MKLFAWDFHGVLEKGNDEKVRVICEELLGKKITLEEVRKHYGKPWGDYFRELKGTEDEKEIEELVEKAIETSMRISEKYVKPNDHAKEVLGEIRQKGDYNVIISNTRSHRLDSFLEEVGLLEFFDEKIGIDAEFEKGTSKTKTFGQVLSSQVYANKSVDFKSGKIIKLIEKYSPEQTIAIGDSESDIEAGKRAKAVTFMYDPWKRHLNTKADYRITDLREVLRVYL